MSKKDLIENIDYYIENGKWVFTEKYHLDRGFCCKPHVDIKYSCRHCPYRTIKKDSESSIEHSQK